MVWYAHLFQNFPQFFVIRTVKGFGVINKAEIDVFLELSCFFDDPADVGDLISGSYAFSKTRWQLTSRTLQASSRSGGKAHGFRRQGKEEDGRRQKDMRPGRGGVKGWGSMGKNEEGEVGSRREKRGKGGEERDRVKGKAIESKMRERQRYSI